MVRAPGQTGLVPWFLQRATGALLALWVALHFIFWHFRHSHEQGITADQVAANAKGGLWFAWGVALGALCLYHGLNGVRNILFDYSEAARKARWVTPALWAIGIAGAGWVVFTLSRFAFSA